jgi:hypothetical protein
MKAGQKADELFNKMYKYQLDKKSIYSWELAKRCALIAVNEIILANPHGNPLNSNAESTMKYWEEVKKEIELL